MNRIKFNEGGQPVYLDDLQLLQENDISAMKELLKALGNGHNAFLLHELQTEDLIFDETLQKTVLFVKSGTLVLDGEFLTWPETKLQVDDWETPIYLCIRTSDMDTRQFEDGQNRNCRTCKEAYLSVDHSGVNEFYSIYDIPRFQNLVKDMIGYKNTETWQMIKVEFCNYYTGTVRFKEQTECYRVWVDIKSTSYETINGSLVLFNTDKTFLQYFRSSTEAFVRTENSVSSGQLYGFEGTVYLDLQLPVDDATRPSDVPVKIVFEIPK